MGAHRRALDRRALLITSASSGGLNVPAGSSARAGRRLVGLLLQPALSLLIKMLSLLIKIIKLELFLRRHRPDEGSIGLILALGGLALLGFGWRGTGPVGEEPGQH